jgi:5-carboxymethyl-2-hydroxymuconate isomerase
MPHITIEYSSNVADRTDIQQLVERVHRHVLDTGVVPLAGLRTRALPSTNFMVADGQPENGYVGVFARLSAGRTAEQRAAVIASISSAINIQFGESIAGLAISVEYIEIDPDFRVNDNHIRLRPIEPA